MTLAETQAAFHALATRAADPPSAAEDFLVGSPELGAAERVGIYADMYLWRLADALREDYPKLAALLGGERFLALAEAYARQHPSDRPDLGQFGRRLPAFLRRFPAPERGDLADLAALEWARSEVFFEAPATHAGRDALAGLGPEAFLDARLELVPAFRLLVLDHDAAAVWRLLERGEPAGPPLPGPVAVAVWRAGFDVFHARVDLDEALALEAAGRGEPMARVCAAFGRATDPAGAAFAALASWLDEGWVAAVLPRAASGAGSPGPNGPGSRPAPGDGGANGGFDQRSRGHAREAVEPSPQPGS